MPQLFSPKFVDLVRVTTSTQGTGPLVCGPAVQGHATFAESLSVGDSFYYSVQGTEKPQEREVGRGTLQSNGTITRQPLLGNPTAFTSGSKTIALVAASEWFASTQEALTAAGRSGSVGSRLDLKAVASATGLCRYLNEGQREGHFVWDSTIPIAMHQADTAEGIYVAPNAFANGAWVRKFDGPVNVRWFGAKGDSTLAVNGSNDGPAFLAAIAFLKTRSQLTSYGRGSGDLFIPAGVYWLNTSTLDVTHAFTLQGEGGMGAGVMLKWANGTTGIRTQAANTVGASGANPAWTDFTAGRISVRDLMLHGGYGSGTESEAHGVHARVTCELVNVQIYNFPGDGFFSHAVAGGGGSVEGNANLCKITNLSVQACRNGIYVDSADANAMVFQGANTQGNRRWGIWDSSFLGNTYVGCHSAANGLDGAANSVPTACSHNGRRYAVRDRQEAWASTNPPTGAATNNQGWLYFGEGGAYAGMPIWVTGTTFRTGGAYRTDDVNARNVFLSCYSESDCPPALIQGPTLVLGGLHAAGLMNEFGETFGGFLEGESLALIARRNLLVRRDLTVDGSTIVLGPMVSGDGSAILRTANSFFSFRAQYWQNNNPVADIGEMGFFYGFGTLYNVANDGWKHLFRVNGASVANIASSGLELAAGKTLKVADLQVVGSRGAAVADAAVAAAAPTKAEFDALVVVVNTVLARLRASTDKVA